MSSETRLPLSVPNLAGNELAYVRECLDTGWVSTAGPFVQRFEHEVAERVGASDAVATTSGTSALHLALQCSGVQTDDEVLVPSLTFVATANAVRHAGAWPIFVDAEPKYLQIDCELLQDFVDTHCMMEGSMLKNRTTGRRVSAVVPVHVHGHPCDMERILDVANRYGLAVVEDATEALGSTYKEQPAGVIARVGCFSFNANKIITTGGGGMLVSSDSELLHRARHLSTQAKAVQEEYVHDEVGYNYRMTNLQAAVGCAQLERLDEFVTRKREIASAYASQLSQVPRIKLPTEADYARSNWWLYTILVEGKLNRGLRDSLAEQGIQSRVVWQPLHRSPAYSDMQFVGGHVAEAVYDTALSIPCSTSLNDEQQRDVCDAIRSWADGAA